MRTALAGEPVTGMRDITPTEMQIHEYVMNQVKETYRSFGFTQIETPCVEHIGDLVSRQGGDNEKLISKILKRGDKLNLGEAKEEDDLVDSGLRYGLTLPLPRYYANNTANLPGPFKVLQVGSVWRTDRPQRGRFRQFVRCDTDVLGDTTSLTEIELILAVTVALGRICPGNGFTVRINDRGILRGMALYCDFPEESTDQVFITLDKIDKIGYEDTKEELLGSGYCPESVGKYLDTLKNVTKDSAGVRALGQMLSEVMPTNASRGLAHIMDTVVEVAETDFGLEFDPTLARGVSYYTRTISEVSMEGFGGSVADSGCHDRMIGKLTGMETPACGLSTGFERVVIILMDNDFTAPSVSTSKALLFEKGMDNARLVTVVYEAMEERKKGIWVPATQTNKNKKFRKRQLDGEGYTEFKEFYKENLKNQEE